MLTFHCRDRRPAGDGRAQRAWRPGPRGSTGCRHQLLIVSAIALAIMAVPAISDSAGWWLAGSWGRCAPSRPPPGISATNLHERLNLGGPDDEIKELGDTFDDLLGRLERSFEFAAPVRRQRLPRAAHPPCHHAGIARRGHGQARAGAPAIIVLADRLRHELDHVDRLLEVFSSWPALSSGAITDEATLLARRRCIRRDRCARRRHMRHGPRESANRSAPSAQVTGQQDAARPHGRERGRQRREAQLRRAAGYGSAPTSPARSPAWSWRTAERCLTSTRSSSWLGPSGGWRGTDRFGHGHRPRACRSSQSIAEIPRRPTLELHARRRGGSR